MLDNILMKELKLDKDVSNEVKDELKYLLKKDKDEQMKWRIYRFIRGLKGCLMYYLLIAKKRNFIYHYIII